MTFYLTFLSLYGEINESKTSKHVKCRGAGMPQLWAPSPPSNVPRCESRSWRRMWVEFLVVALAPRGLSPSTSCFPLSSKTNISKFQFDLNRVAEELLRWWATANSHVHFHFRWSCYEKKTSSSAFVFSQYTHSHAKIQWKKNLGNQCTPHPEKNRLHHLISHRQRCCQY